MNWQAISFDWNQVRALLATAEEGSFSAAARALGTTQPTVGRQISALEDALGVTLLERSVRGPALTEAGRELIAHVRAMGDAATQISMVASGQSQDVTGEVSVTASDLMAAEFLPSILSGLRMAAPGIRVRIVAANDIRNLAQREADIAIRHVRPEQTELIARRIADLRANLYGATAYLDRSGRPRSLHDLIDHAYVCGHDIDAVVSIMRDRGIPLRPDNVVLTSDSGAVLWQAVRTGIGLSLMPEILGDREPGVERAFDALPSIDVPVWLVTHRELRTSQRIRIVFDCLARGLEDAMNVAARSDDAGRGGALSA